MEISNNDRKSQLIALAIPFAFAGNPLMWIWGSAVLWQRAWEQQVKPENESAP